MRQLRNKLLRYLLGRKPSGKVSYDVGDDDDVIKFQDRAYDHKPCCPFKMGPQSNLTQQQLLSTDVSCALQVLGNVSR